MRFRFFSNDKSFFFKTVITAIVNLVFWVLMRIGYLVCNMADVFSCNLSIRRLKILHVRSFMYFFNMHINYHSQGVRVCPFVGSVCIAKFG